jgi:hypothetical protein
MNLLRGGLRAMDEREGQAGEMIIKKAPFRLAIFALVGPSMVCASGTLHDFVV